MLRSGKGVIILFATENAPNKRELTPAIPISGLNIPARGNRAQMCMGTYVGPMRTFVQGKDTFLSDSLSENVNGTFLMLFLIIIDRRLI